MGERTRTIRTAPDDSTGPTPGSRAAAGANTEAGGGGRPPRNEDELHAWLIRALRVHVPRRGLADGDGPFEYLAHAFFEGRPPGRRAGSPAAPGGREARPGDCVVWANRGGGKTFLAAVATVLDLVFKKGIEVRLLGGSLEQSRRMHEHLSRLLRMKELAADVGPLKPKITARGAVLANRSRAEVMAQSERSVRGTRVQKVRCDEADLFQPDVWHAVQLTTRSIDLAGPWGDSVLGSVEALSTMHRPMGLMRSIVRACETPAVALDPLGGGEPARRLIRWGVTDVLEPCPATRSCQRCCLWDECLGRAKGRAPEQAGHVRIDDAAAMKTRVPLEVWRSEMLCLGVSRGSCVYPDFDRKEHVSKGGEHDDGALGGGDRLRLAEPDGGPVGSAG
ncbi:MAG: hypothetical protein JNM07_04220 [Phycisphaerae bacterium]|nr:hypothetical protein [Phycisphaerae bacterium]